MTGERCGSIIFAMTILGKADDYTTCKPGQWCRMDGRVFMRCPHEHGVVSMLTGHEDPARDWQIAADGTVSPSVAVIEPKDCGFHDYVKLESWAA